jgi:Flp pilus assembly protein TadD
MLRDLAAMGCVPEDGTSGDVNNPLSHLGKAVLNSSRQHDMGGGAGSSSEADAALPPFPSGPGASSASELLPPMAPTDQAFMHAVENSGFLQHGWDQSATHGPFSPPAHQQFGPPADMAQLDAAWASSGHDPAMHAHMQLGEAAVLNHEHFRPHPSHFSAPFVAGGAPPGALLQMANQGPHYPYSPQRQMPYPPAHSFAFEPPMPRAQPTADRAAPSSISGTPLSSEEVRLLDAAHEEAWRSLASAGAPLGQGLGSAMPPPQSVLPAVPAGENEIEKAYLETVAQGLAEGATADSRSSSELNRAFTEMEEVWKSLSVQDRAAVGRSLGGDAAADLDSVWQSLRNADYDASWEDAWVQGMSGDALDVADADAPYRFHKNNPYIGSTDLLQRGIDLFRRGELSEAVLVLEAAVQTQPDDSIAWQTLGQAHADTDDDAQAIACLRRAVASDPHNLDALLALGVSYTNELDQTRALRHLQLWLESHPDFTDIGSGEAGVAAPPRPGALENPFELQRRVTDLFLHAVEKRPENADLHAVLGVLHNLSRSYPEAVASFEAALRMRPDDYSLWNKLGATRANAMSCAEAVPCYVKALELKPQYVRALSNLGISYGNMANYEAAAQCYLKALSLNREASHIWGYLTMNFTSMGRADLVAKAGTAEHEAFRVDFDF